MRRALRAIGPSASGTTAPRGARGFRAARAAGLVAGVAAFAVLAHSWTVTTAAAGFGTDLVVSAAAPGELEVTPSGELLQAVAMRPGSLAGGVVRVRNITGGPVAVRLRVAPSTPELDDVVDLAVTSGGRRLAVGSAGELRGWSERRLLIGVRDSASLELRAQLRRPTQGLIAEIRLVLDVKAIGRR